MELRDLSLSLVNNFEAHVEANFKPPWSLVKLSAWGAVYDMYSSSSNIERAVLR